MNNELLPEKVNWRFPPDFEVKYRFLTPAEGVESLMFYQFRGINRTGHILTTTLRKLGYG